MKTYLNTKKETLEANNYLIMLESKIKKIIALKRKYKYNPVLFNQLKKYCKIKNKYNEYIIKCENLDTNKFNFVQNIIFKNNFKLKKFDIQKNKLSNIEVEIIK